MQLDILREYVLLAKTLNYHVAAKELHVSQPTLSNHISSLEKELSLSLIDRSHGIRFTKTGAAFLEWAAETIASYDEMLKKCKAISREESFSFSVQMPKIIGHAAAIFVECVQQFKESHPQTSVNILPFRDKFVLDEILNAYCDCAIFLEQMKVPEIDPEYQELALAPLCQEEAVAWMKKDNPLTQKSDLSLQDLIDLSIPIHVNNNARVWEMAIDNDFQTCGMKPTFSYRYAASSEEFVLTKLRDNDVLLLPKGYPDSPPYKFRDDRVAARFNPPVIVTAYVAYRKDENKTALLEFISSINEKYQESSSGTAARTQPPKQPQH